MILAALYVIAIHARTGDLDATQEQPLWRSKQMVNKVVNTSAECLVFSMLSPVGGKLQSKVDDQQQWMIRSDQATIVRMISVQDFGVYGVEPQSKPWT